MALGETTTKSTSGKKTEDKKGGGKKGNGYDKAVSVSFKVSKGMDMLELQMLTAGLIHGLTERTSAYGTPSKATLRDREARSQHNNAGVRRWLESRLSDTKKVDAMCKKYETFKLTIRETVDSRDALQILIEIWSPALDPVNFAQILSGEPKNDESISSAVRNAIVASLDAIEDFIADRPASVADIVPIRAGRLVEDDLGGA